MTTFSIFWCFSVSLAVDPSPPPIINTVLGLKIIQKIKRKDKNKNLLASDCSPTKIILVKRAKPNMNTAHTYDEVTEQDEPRTHDK